MPAQSLPSMDADRITSITTAFAQVASSLRELANNNHEGVDLVSTLVTMLGAGTGAGAPFVAAAQVPSDAELITRSRDLIDALDRGDAKVIEATLAPGFLFFEGGPPRDRDSVLARINQRPTKIPYIATRTWDSESVVRKDDALVFTGMAHELQGGNDSHGGYLYDGWYLVQWAVPATCGAYSC